jgi:hypothetical protein
MRATLGSIKGENFLRRHGLQPRAPVGGWSGKGATSMPKPPPTPPHSDLDGVHQDARRTPDAAAAAGQDAGDVEQARRQSAGRPAPQRRKN